MNDIEKILLSVSDLLEHVKEVEEDMVTLSAKSMKDLSSFISQENICLDEKSMQALQHQDILAQQLGATGDTLELVMLNIEKYMHSIKSDSSLLIESFEALDEKLQVSLQKAKEKKSAFSGYSLETDRVEEEIEFF